MQITGDIIYIGETQTYGDNNFRKREIVIKTNEQYPQEIISEFIQDKCDILDKFNLGDCVCISLNLRGRSWTNPQGETKYFNTLQAWRIEFTANQNNPSTDPIPQTPTSTQNPEPIQAEDEDDLPF